MGWREPVALVIVEQAYEQTRRLCIFSIAPNDIVCSESSLHFVPELLRNDRGVFTRILYAPVSDLAKIDRILQQAVEGTARINSSARFLSSSASDMVTDWWKLGLLLQRPDGTFAEVDRQ